MTHEPECPQAKRATGDPCDCQDLISVASRNHAQGVEDALEVLDKIIAGYDAAFPWDRNDSALTTLDSARKAVENLLLDKAVENVSTIGSSDDNPWGTPWSADEPGLCGCRTCVDARAEEERAAGAPYSLTLGSMGRFIVCEECGNKRCPHATDHNLTCTGSNEPGQPGSVYGSYSV